MSGMTSKFVYPVINWMILKLYAFQALNIMYIMVTNRKSSRKSINYFLNL